MSTVAQSAPDPRRACPFCGEPAEALQVIPVGRDKIGTPEYIVTCGWCYASAPLNVWQGSNSRSPHAAKVQK